MTGTYVALLPQFIDMVVPPTTGRGWWRSASRVGRLLAKRDPARPMEKYPIYDLGDGPRQWAGAWQTLLDSVQPEYVATPGALDAFRAAFAELLREGLPGSFYRRILWTAHKYALVYHVLRGLGSNPTLTAKITGGRPASCRFTWTMQPNSWRTTGFRNWSSISARPKKWSSGSAKRVWRPSGGTFSPASGRTLS